MKLVDLVQYLIGSKQLEYLYKEKEVNIESEAILIYLKDSIGLESDVHLFPIEETEDDQIFIKDGVTYIQLFPVEMAIDLVEPQLDLKNKAYSNLDIAERLIHYRLYDA